jgi:hypothetical protein
MKSILLTLAIGVFVSLYATVGFAGCNRFDPNCISNPYGAGSPYKHDGLMNPHSQFGSLTATSRGATHTLQTHPDFMTAMVATVASLVQTPMIPTQPLTRTADTAASFLRIVLTILMALVVLTPTKRFMLFLQGNERAASMFKSSYGLLG